MTPQVALVRTLLTSKKLDEWHIWNFSRNENDNKWLRQTFGASKIIQRPAGHIPTPTLLDNPTNSICIRTNPTPGSWIDIFTDSKQVHRLSFEKDKFTLCTEQSDQHESNQNAKESISHLIKKNNTLKKVLNISDKQSQQTKSLRRIEKISNTYSRFIKKTPRQKQQEQTIETGHQFNQKETKTNIDVFIHIDPAEKCLVFRIGDCRTSLASDALRIIKVKGGGRLECELEWRITSPDQKITLIEPNLKGYEGFKKFYEYYGHSDYADTVFTKIDDDIIFFDASEFEAFMEQAENASTHTLTSANVINNGVCAHYQSKWGYFKRLNYDFEYPKNGFGGTLWESWKKCSDLHDFFCAHHSEIIANAKSNRRIQKLPPKDRFSINFIAFKQPVMLMMSQAYIRTGMTDDEHLLTVELANFFGIQKQIFEPLVASHLSFYKQEDLLDCTRILNLYNAAKLSSSQQK